MTYLGMYTLASLVLTVIVWVCLDDQDPPNYGLVEVK
jgi:hypothetical protein